MKDTGADNSAALQQKERPNPRAMPVGYVVDGSVYTYPVGHPYYEYHRRRHWYRYNRSAFGIGGIIVLLVVIVIAVRTLT